ncbi:MAG: dihydroxyacetone kinase subunit DhaL [Paraclostridium sp.]
MNNLIIKSILKGIVESVEKEKEYLIELDGSMGDGDLGLTMYNGFSALYEEIDNIDSNDLGMTVMKLGMKMNSVVPSTMGTLVSVCMIRGAKTLKGKQIVTLDDLIEFGDAAINGVKEVGKTEVGNKTMLDALYPAVEGLKEAKTEGLSIGEAINRAYEKASEGVEKTKELKSVHGRAAYYGDNSVGKPDPGATAVKFIIRGIKESSVICGGDIVESISN